MSISSLAHLCRSVLVIPSAFFPIPGAGASGAATGAVVSWFLITLGLFPEAISFLTMATASPTAVIFMVTTFTAFTAVNFTVKLFMIFMVAGRGLTIGKPAALLRRTWHRTATPARSADSTMAVGQTTFPAAANPVSAAVFMAAAALPAGCTVAVSAEVTAASVAVMAAVAVVAATGSQFAVQLSCYERIGLERSSHGYKRQFKKISWQCLG